MARKPPDVIILGKGPVAAALKAVLKLPVVPRRSDDLGWDWQKSGIADRSKVIMVASPHAGTDGIVRHHAEIWTGPGASRLGVVIVVPDRSVAERLMARDIFGRKQARESTFADYGRWIRIVGHPITLQCVIATVNEVTPLLKDTWERLAKDASCLPRLLEAIRGKSVMDLEQVVPLAQKVHWDSICHPTPKFPNHHQYAYAIDCWLRSVTPGVTPDWEAGFRLFSPLAHS